jgi:putative addiction module killer protein
MIKLVEYLDEHGRSPFETWFESLEARAAAKVVIATEKLRQGHFGNVKSVGSGVSEYRIDCGPGYRIYFAKDGDRLIILLAGGSKKRQQQDIEDAQYRWQQYKARKQT